MGSVEEPPCPAGDNTCQELADAATSEEVRSMKASLLQIRTPKTNASEMEDVAMLEMGGKGSCKGTCGAPYKRGRSCQCNDGCYKHKSCCADYKTECVREAEPDEPATGKRLGLFMFNPHGE